MISLLVANSPLIFCQSNKLLEKEWDQWKERNIQKNVVSRFSIEHTNTIFESKKWHYLNLGVFETNCNEEFWKIDKMHKLFCKVINSIYWILNLKKVLKF